MTEMSNLPPRPATNQHQNLHVQPTRSSSENSFWIRFWFSDSHDCVPYAHSKAVYNLLIHRDQPNSQEKMRDFMVEFFKCAKFHGKFTEGV